MPPSKGCGLAGVLGFTSRPALDAQALTFVTYGGGGPRMLAFVIEPAGGVILGVGGTGGFELRYAQAGVFLELDATFPFLGVSALGAEFTPLFILVPKVSLGLNYHF